MANAKKATLASPETRDNVTHARITDMKIDFNTRQVRLTYGKFTDAGVQDSASPAIVTMSESDAETIEDLVLAQAIAEEKISGTKADL